MHPEYLVGEDLWEVVRLARNWDEGVLPEAGGVEDQAAWTAAAISIVRSAWGRMRTAEDKKRKG